MTYPSRPTRAEIDLGALRDNLRTLKASAGSGQGILAVVKADAYGHGAVAVSRALEQEGVAALAVATLEEGVELRAAGLRSPLLVFGGCYPGQEEAFVAYGLMPVVFDMHDLQRLTSWTGMRKQRLSVHLKCDTGMGRVGFQSEELPHVLSLLRGAPGIVVEGLMSHLACADDAGSAATHQQIDVFRRVVEQFRQAGISPQNIHLSNSAGVVGWDISGCNLVRPGIALYGGAPLCSENETLGLRPVMTFVTEIRQVRHLAAGTSISYGHTYQTRRDSQVAVLPVGYADGYNRLFSNRGEVLICGQRAPIVGRVCMDWILADVTEIGGAEAGSRVVLLGRDGTLEISASEWAEGLGTIDYEVFCRIGSRVPRLVVNGGAV